MKIEKPDKVFTLSGYRYYRSIQRSGESNTYRVRYAAYVALPTRSNTGADRSRSSTLLSQSTPQATNSAP